jgi:hypothetical protein
MRKPFSLLSASAVAAALFCNAVTPRPAAACLSFDFDGEVAAVDRALAHSNLSSSEAAEIKGLRDKAVEMDQHASRLNNEAQEIASKRNGVMFQALDKLGLTPITLYPYEVKTKRNRGTVGPAPTGHVAIPHCG